jgi:ferritin
MDKPILNKVKPTYKGGLSEVMTTLINSQIEVEASSSQIYLAMAAWADPMGYTGAAKFFRKHYKEEREHMLKLYDFMADKNVVATTPMLSAPDCQYTDLYDVLDTALVHEYYVTSTYEKASEMALNEPSHQCYNLFQYFIKEQVEEESLFKTICDKYNIMKKYGIDGAAILQFDEWLGELAE